MLDKKLLAILVCPICKAKLQFEQEQNELLCINDKLAFPIKDGIPVMLQEEARIIDSRV